MLACTLALSTGALPRCFCWDVDYPHSSLACLGAACALLPLLRAPFSPCAAAGWWHHAATSAALPFPP
eukprot:scaffold5818_cov15-Tisochrysis_lutea.AAC.1